MRALLTLHMDIPKASCKRLYIRIQIVQCRPGLLVNSDFITENSCSYDEGKMFESQDQTIRRQWQFVVQVMTN